MSMFSAEVEHFALYLPDDTPLLPDSTKVLVDLNDDPPVVEYILMMDAADAEDLEDSGVFGDLDLPTDPSATYTLEVHLVSKSAVARGQADFLKAQDNPALAVGKVEAPPDETGFNPLYRVDNYELTEWTLHDVITYGLEPADDDGDENWD